MDGVVSGGHLRIGRPERLAPGRIGGDIADIQILIFASVIDAQAVAGGQRHRVPGQVDIAAFRIDAIAVGGRRNGGRGQIIGVIGGEGHAVRARKHV